MPIQVLPPQLANQIAAGEVVERPASVVKELVENSLDAGATRIDIDIEKGGAKLIRIRDNGSGIKKDELALALARHATSKIASLDDLEAIVSLGFRGEALASISSVSRLTLTSRTAEQNEAWQAYAEGRDMQVEIKPAAHPNGTSIEVLDLFYNTPARRKFLRTEKTEFSHIDEVIRRIALARCDVAFNLQHNGKLIRQYRPVKAGLEQQEKRLAAICGAAFIQHALQVTWQHGDLAIRGWIATPEGARQLNDLQYSYVNGRMIRDRLINHAIRQAYQTTLNDEQQPAYVLYIDVDPHQVDVNVHPAKHEVRFHQSRLVHDFIYQAVATALQQIDRSDALFVPSTPSDSAIIIENRSAAGQNSFNRPVGAESAKAASTGKNNANSAAFHMSPSTNYLAPKASEKYLAEERQLYGHLIQSSEMDGNVVVGPKSPGLAPTLQERPVLFPAKKQGISDIPAFSCGDSPKIGKVLTIWRDSFAVVEYQNGLALLALTKAEQLLKTVQLRPKEDNLKSQPLLIPLKLTLTPAETAGYATHEALLTRLGIDVKLGKDRAEVRAVCLPLRQQNLQLLLPMMFNYLSKRQELTLEELTDWLVRQLGSEHDVWQQSQAINVITELERLCPEAFFQAASGLIHSIDLDSALLALNNE
jgi:DNA mismatch repair protein MutL